MVVLSLKGVVYAVQLPAEPPAKEWLFVPTLAVLGLLIWRQRARRDKAAFPHYSGWIVWAWRQSISTKGSVPFIPFFSWLGADSELAHVEC